VKLASNSRDRPAERGSHCCAVPVAAFCPACSSRESLALTWPCYAARRRSGAAPDFSTLAAESLYQLRGRVGGGWGGGQRSVTARGGLPMRPSPPTYLPAGEGRETTRSFTIRRPACSRPSRCNRPSADEGVVGPRGPSRDHADDAAVVSGRARVMIGRSDTAKHDLFSEPMKMRTPIARSARWGCRRTPRLSRAVEQAEYPLFSRS